MAQYIDKSAVVAEIEKLKGLLLKGACASQISMQTNCKEEAYNEILSFLDTLEVKNAEESKNQEWSAEDERNLNAILSFIDDEYLRRWLKDVVHERYD